MRLSACIILATTLMSLALGYTMPLLAITLKAAGASNAQIGISAAAPSLAILVTGFSARSVIAFFGFRKVLLLSAVVLCGGLSVLSATTDLYVWFVTRAAIGATNGMLWISLESWLNHVTPAALKGRVVGIYAAATTLAFACGSLFPIATLHPSLSFVTAAALFCVGVGVCLFVRAPVFSSTDASLRALLSTAASLVTEGAMAFATGVLVSIQIALLPTVTPLQAAVSGKSLLSATLFGAVAAQLLAGVMTDRWGSERITLPLIVAGIVVSAALLPGNHWGIAPQAIYFCWGGLSNALYSLALTRLGIRKTGHELLVGNAALLLAYETGTLIGPIVGGVLSDLAGAAAFSAISVVTFVILTLVIGVTNGRRHFQTTHRDSMANACRGKTGK